MSYLSTNNNFPRLEKERGKKYVLQSDGRILSIPGTIPKGTVFVESNSGWYIIKDPNKKLHHFLVPYYKIEYLELKDLSVTS